MGRVACATGAVAYGEGMKRLAGLPLLLLALCLLPTVATAQPPSKADEEEPTVTGIEYARADGGYLGLNVEGNAFVLRFYDEDKIETTPNAVRALARWNQPQKAGTQRAVLASTGQALRSPPVARPPYAFIVYLTLIGPDDQVMESVPFNIRDLP